MFKVLQIGHDTQSPRAHITLFYACVLNWEKKKKKTKKKEKRQDG